MKLYVKLENTQGETHCVIVEAPTKIEGAVKAIRLSTKFIAGKVLKPRIYVSEVGFEKSKDYTWLDTNKVITKAGFEAL